VSHLRVLSLRGAGLGGRRARRAGTTRRRRGGWRGGGCGTAARRLRAKGAVWLIIGSFVHWVLFHFIIIEYTCRAVSGEPGTAVRAAALFDFSFFFLFTKMDSRGSGQHSQSQVSRLIPIRVTAVVEHSTSAARTAVSSLAKQANESALAATGSASRFVRSLLRLDVRLPVDVEICVLEQLQAEIFTAYDRSCSDHEDLLRRLWSACQSSSDSVEDSARFQREGVFWKDIGFQQADPATDIRGGGLLALRSLVFFVENFPSIALAMIASRKNRVVGEGATAVYSSYPWAAAGINLTRMLCQIFDVITPAGGRGNFKMARKSFWSCIAGSERFSRLFCFAFQMLDRKWDFLGATYMQFNSVLESTKVELVDLLQQEGASGFKNALLFLAVSESEVEDGGAAGTPNSSARVAEGGSKNANIAE
jgi:hypothetical protein